MLLWYSNTNKPDNVFMLRVRVCCELGREEELRSGCFCFATGSCFVADVGLKFPKQAGLKFGIHLL